MITRFMRDTLFAAIEIDELQCFVVVHKYGFIYVQGAKDYVELLKKLDVLL